MVMTNKEFRNYLPYQIRRGNKNIGRKILAIKQYYDLATDAAVMRYCIQVVYREIIKETGGQIGNRNTNKSDSTGNEHDTV